MAESTPTKFRVIIVGAGPVGLYLAHALHRANVDFVVLEQSESVHRFQGAGIILYQSTMRLLDQIGLYETAEKDFLIGHDMTDLLAANGQVTKSAPLWDRLAEQHAYPLAGVSRAQFIGLVYENLPEKETRVKTGAGIVDIETDEKGVTVHLKDGSTEEGSIVIGADGVHSKTRRILQQKLAQTPPDTWPMTASYHGLFGCFKPVPGMNPGVFYQSRGAGLILQAFCGVERGHYIVLRSIPPATETKRYTTEERDAFAKGAKHHFAAPGVRFEDIWKNTDKETAAMVNQEEGYCDKWYHGRVALVGDAVHKATSVSGLGLNTAVNSAAALANELYRVLESDPDPSTSALEDAFARYQQVRTHEGSQLFHRGREQIRGSTWATWGDWFFDRFVVPWISVDTVVGLFSKLIQRGQILEYVPFKDREVRSPWINKPPPLKV